MKANLCDRCGERIYDHNPARPERRLVRVYIESVSGLNRDKWHDFHADCAKDMTINDILNGGTA